MDFFKISAIRVLLVSFLTGCQFSDRYKLSRYRGTSAALISTRGAHKKFINKVRTEQIWFRVHFDLFPLAHQICSLALCSTNLGFCSSISPLLFHISNYILGLRTNLLMYRSCFFVVRILFTVLILLRNDFLIIVCLARLFLMLVRIFNQIQLMKNFFSKSISFCKIGCYLLSSFSV